MAGWQLPAKNREQERANMINQKMDTIGIWHRITLEREEAKEAVAEIAESIIRWRGDIPTINVRIWGNCYKYWTAATDALTAEEVALAIHEGRTKALAKERGEV